MSKNDHVETPTPALFRAWVQRATVTLEQRPAQIARSIGASVNSVGAFLREPDRDITLSRAHEIERHLRAVAAEQGKVLPRIGEAADE